MTADEEDVFLSYARIEKALAVRFRDALRQRGLRVYIDDDWFEAGLSIYENMGRAINRASAVLAIVSTNYLDRDFTELELSAAMAASPPRLVPALVGGTPHPATEKGRGLWTMLQARSYLEVDFTDFSIDRLEAAIRHKITATPGHLPEEEQPLAPDRPLVLLYDWEDTDDVDATRAQLTSNGLRVRSVRTAGSMVDRPTADDESILAVLWTEAAQGSTEIAQEALEATVSKRGLAYVWTGEGSPPPTGALRLRIEQDDRRRSPVRTPRKVSTRDPASVRSSIERAVAENGGVPFHILGDKFCAKRSVARDVAAACEEATSRFRLRHPARLVAVVANAAVRRFHGAWADAEKLLDTEMFRGSPPHAGDKRRLLALQAEWISLQFELGRVAEVAQKASEFLRLALGAEEWTGVIAMHRLLGMINEEQGDYPSARDHHQRAVHYAEEFMSTALLTEVIPEPAGRHCLMADCLRELAALEWRAGDAQLALAHLTNASSIVSGDESSGASEYLRYVIQYQRARVTFSVDHDYELASRDLEDSYRALLRFDNPIRLATVLESLARLKISFMRRNDEDVLPLRSTLDKVCRVRTARGHDYTVARTRDALGDLDFVLCHWTEAIEHYDIARVEFNRLGKLPDAVTSTTSLSRCYAKLGDTDSAIELLEGMLSELDASQHRDVSAQIHAELARLRPRRTSSSAIDEATEMTGVGEFLVHAWMANDLAIARTAGTHVVIGVGDDGAVLAPDDDHIVASTDSVPPELLKGDDLGSVEYAARFAVVSGLSDVLAMGGTPTAMLLNLHLPRSKSATWTRSFLRTCAREAAVYDAQIVGGDLKECASEALTTVALGKVKRGHAVTRSGARPGDGLFMTLSSYPGRAFKGLGTRWAQSLNPYLSRRERSVIEALMASNPMFEELGLPLDTMQLIVQRQLASAAIDTSDGLLGCAQLLGLASDVGIELFPLALENLVNSEVRQLATILGVAPFLFALNAGHDWEVVLTASEANAPRVAEIGTRAKTAFPSVAAIGQVVDRQQWSEDGVLLRQRSPSPVLLPYFTDEKFVPTPHSDRANEWLGYARESTLRMAGDTR